jgi:hypothetical protein
MEKLFLGGRWGSVRKSSKVLLMKLLASFSEIWRMLFGLNEL